MSIMLTGNQVLIAAVLGIALMLGAHRLVWRMLRVVAMFGVMFIAGFLGLEVVDPSERRRERRQQVDEVREPDPYSENDDKMRRWVFDLTHEGQFAALRASASAASDGVVPITPYEEWRAEFLSRMAASRRA